MTRYTLTVPTHYNDGRPVPRTILAEIETTLAEIGGGWTLTAGTGGWIGATDDVYREPVSLYAVDTDDPRAPDAMRSLAERTATVLGQEAVYLTRQEIGAELVYPAPVAA